MLYRATLNPFYLHVGLDILYSLNAFTKVKCGYATIHNVVDKTLEDRMESFFISETVKYLFLVSYKFFAAKIIFFSKIWEIFFPIIFIS